MKRKNENTICFVNAESGAEVDNSEKVLLYLYIIYSFYKNKMLQAANTDLFNLLVPILTIVSVKITISFTN